MNVLHIIEGVDTKLGGLPTAMYSIRHIEQTIDIKSHILSLSEEENISDGITHLFPSSFPKRFYKSSKAINWLKKNIHMYDLIVIHAFWNFLCIESALVSIKHKKKYVIWPHGSLDPFDLQKKKFLKKGLGKLLAAKILNNAEALCFTCDEESLQVETYNTNVNKVVLPLPVETRHYENSSGSDFRSRYGINDNDFVFLFLGRINYKKGLDKIIYATANLYKEHKNVKVLIVGHDVNKLADHLKKMINDMGLNKVIQFCGELVQSAKADAFYGSDCFILPSLNENYGIAIIEALQHSLPVIISNNVYIWKEIIDLNGGWVCEATEESLLKKMKFILSDNNDYLDKKASAKSAGNFFLPANLKLLYKEFYDNV